MDKLESGAEKLGLSIDPDKAEQFDIYYRELSAWNRTVNLTAITDYEEVQVKHFLDSLTVIQILPGLAAGEELCIIDIGTGAGMPGVPLNILFPDIKLVLIEATLKKVSFLHNIKEKLGLKNIEIVTGRAEEIAHIDDFREKFDVALSRAVARLATLAELTLPFCTAGGTVITQKKGDIEEEIKQAGTAINILGGKLREVKRVELDELSDERYLVVIDKISATPGKYPRRPGVPAKRPII